MSSCYARRCLYTLGLVAAQTYLIDDRWMDYVNALMKRVLGLSSYLVQVWLFSESHFFLSPYHVCRRSIPISLANVLPSFSETTRGQYFSH